MHNDDDLFSEDEESDWVSGGLGAVKAAAIGLWMMLISAVVFGTIALRYWP